MSKHPLLAWVDLEMTGLEPDTDVIVQMALILTDTELNEVAPPLDITIWQPESALEKMCPFVRQMHTKNGLLPEIQKSQISVADAEKQALKLLSKHTKYGEALLCGNSIWQDRRFLVRYMPSFTSYLHYRMIDVSTIKQLSKWWYR
ncbi:oligoribonuclease, partial [Myxococcota bacterium]|nr:oligoribonuclease [Myxococcota bacterium]